MQRRWKRNLILLVLLGAFFTELGFVNVLERGRENKLKGEIVMSSEFRRQTVGKPMMNYIKKTGEPGTSLALYWLETDWGKKKFRRAYEKKTFKDLQYRWEYLEKWDEYEEVCVSVWNAAECFPVPDFTTDRRATVSFEDSWMYERNYGRKSGHEGCDIMAGKNIRGYYPVVSMTDGVVHKMGWLEKGGYRIGIMNEYGAYFYYAHLSSYARVREGDSVKAGDMLGFMGDTGYSKTEGTVGKFPVHLHVGVYIYKNGKEISVNPYPLLLYLQDKKQE